MNMIAKKHLSSPEDPVFHLKRQIDELHKQERCISDHVTEVHKRDPEKIVSEVTILMDVYTYVIDEDGGRFERTGEITTLADKEYLERELKNRVGDYAEEAGGNVTAGVDMFSFSGSLSRMKCSPGIDKGYQLWWASVPVLQDALDRLNEAVEKGKKEWQFLEDESNKVLGQISNLELEMAKAGGKSLAGAVLKLALGFEQILEIEHPSEGSKDPAVFLTYSALSDLLEIAGIEDRKALFQHPELVARFEKHFPLLKNDA